MQSIYSSTPCGVLCPRLTEMRRGGDNRTSVLQMDSFECSVEILMGRWGHWRQPLIHANANGPQGHQHNTAAASGQDRLTRKTL